MRFPRFRRRRKRSPVIGEAVLHLQPLIHQPILSTASQTVADVRWAMAPTRPAASKAAPSQPKEEKLTAEARRGRILRSTTKRQPRTAGEIAVRSGLAAADGSGRAIAADLAALVEEHQLVRHGRKGHYSYTRA